MNKRDKKHLDMGSLYMARSSGQITSFFNRGGFGVSADIRRNRAWVYDCDNIPTRLSPIMTHKEFESWTRGFNKGVSMTVMAKVLSFRRPKQ